MTKGQHRSLRFTDLGIEEDDADDFVLAARVLSAADVRQLTVYAELARRREELERPFNLMLLYPFVGPAGECLPDSVKAWNESDFWLVPVKVAPVDVLSDAIPSLDKTKLSVT